MKTIYIIWLDLKVPSQRLKETYPHGSPAAHAMYTENGFTYAFAKSNPNPIPRILYRDGGPD